MSRSIQIHQSCYSSLPHIGWHTFVVPEKVDLTKEVEQHCNYPSWPENARTAGCVAHGFRYLTDDWACIFRTVFPSGSDEVGRPVHLTQTQLMTRNDLDRIDADVMALFELLLRRGEFHDSTSEVVEQFRDADFRAAPVEISIDEVRNWREEKNRYQLSSWLAAYPEEDRQQVAERALRLAFRPDADSRPVLWSGTEDGQGQSPQEFAVLQFLFAVLPHAWRRTCSFSTYRPTSLLHGFRWMSTVQSSMKITDDVLDRGYYVANWQNRELNSSPPRDDHPWIRKVLTHLSEPPNHSGVETAVQFANWLNPQSEEDVIDPEGFLQRSEACRLALVDPKSDFHNALKFLRSSARSGRLDLFGQLFQLIERLRENNASLFNTRLEEIVKTALKLIDGLQDEDLLQQSDFIHRLAPHLQALLLDTITAEDFDLTSQIFDTLSGVPTLIEVRNQILPRVVDEVAAMIDRCGDPEWFSDVAQYFRGHLASLPMDHPSRQKFSLAARQCIAEVPEMIASLSESADVDIFPFFEVHAPTSVNEFVQGVRVFERVRRRNGPDLVGKYLVAACRNIDGGPILDQFVEDGGWMLLKHEKSWKRYADKLPSGFRELVTTTEPHTLWESMWQSAKTLPDASYWSCLAKGLKEADDDQGSRFEIAYQEGGATELVDGIRLLMSQLQSKLDQPGGVKIVSAVIDAHLAAIDIGTRTCPPTVDSTPIRHLLACWDSILFLQSSTAVNCPEPEIDPIEKLIKRWSWTPHQFWDFVKQFLLHFNQSQQYLPAIQDEQWRKLLTVTREAFGRDDVFRGKLVHCAIQIARKSSPGSESEIDDRLLDQVIVFLVRNDPAVAAIGGEQSPLAEFVRKRFFDRRSLREALLKKIRGDILSGDESTISQWLAEKGPGWTVVQSVTAGQPWDRMLDRTTAEVNWRRLVWIHRSVADADLDALVADRLRKCFRTFIASETMDPLAALDDAWDELAHLINRLSVGELDTYRELFRSLARDVVMLQANEGGAARIISFADIFDQYLGRLKKTADVMKPLKLRSALDLALSRCARQDFRDSEIIRYLESIDASDDRQNSRILRELTRVDDYGQKTRAVECHSRLAASIWVDRNLEAFSEYLACVGDPQSADENSYNQSRSKHPVMTKCSWGESATAIAVRAFLDGPFGPPGATWEDRLDIRSHDPHLWGLLNATVPGRNVDYFGGKVDATGFPRWLSGVTDSLLDTRKK